ncbi:MAG TPA: prenyltransferase/squalene oxidase repeat-containing protein [Solirubrobacteraceae bacterium]|nr:prenyltransferase/squalene oxidase repeat-containing protein [Solirubrobacteraceae bacterium]
MTWQLGAFAILAVALAGGFAWYERVHPDARVVALVGTLAAFAALGRIAFAAFPNVKPTTDIVLVSGYALGGGPGFAVGALAGLASNFFFGQGPWTPWQMAGWGATGVIGAGLAIVTARRIGRWPLALVCAVVGFAFTALQDVGDWVTYSDHSLAQLGVYVGKGIGFDFVHAAGCLVFALAFGPALIRSLSRFTMRLNVTWQAAAPLLGLILGVGIGVAGAGPTRASAASTPAGYLLAAQNADGGFGASPGSGSSALYAGWAALGLAAAGENPQDVVRDGHSLIGYVEDGAGSSDPGDVERNILVAAAAGVPATSFGGHDLVAELRADFRPNGSVNNQTNWTSFAVLALRASGLAPGPATLSWLLRQQDGDGGFNFGTRGGLSDVDDTGAALEALAGVGGSAASHVRARAVAYIRGQQDRDGGFPSMPAAGSNAQSTAFGVQGLLGAGVDPSSLHRRGAPSPLDYLRSLIAGDGHIRYSRSADETPVWVTAEALMALDGKALPILARRTTPARTATTVHPAATPHPATNAHRAGPRTKPTVPPPHRHTGRPSGRVRPAPVTSEAGAGVDPLAADAGVLTAVSLAFVAAN